MTKITIKIETNSKKISNYDRPVNQKKFFMSPRSTKQFEEIREASKEKILDAAFELFAKQGFHATSINQIAKTAGVAKGLIYNYFEKKEDLMTGIVLRGLQETEGIVAQIMQAAPGKERLRAMIDLTFYFLEEKYDYQKLMASLALQIDQFPDLKEMVVGKYKSMIPMLTHELTLSGHEHPEKHATILGAVLDGIGLQYVVLGTAAPLEKMKQFLIEEYCS